MPKPTKKQKEAAKKAAEAAAKKKEATTKETSKKPKITVFRSRYKGLKAGTIKFKDGIYETRDQGDISKLKAFMKDHPEYITIDEG